MQKIKEIVLALEARTETLLSEFDTLKYEIELFSANHPFINMEEAEELKPTLNKMIEIFVEFRPIEKLIRHKFKQHAVIFDTLSKIIFERENGKFFSFLAAGAFGVKRKYNKKQVLIAPAHQTEIQ